MIDFTLLLARLGGEPLVTWFIGASSLLNDKVIRETREFCLRVRSQAYLNLPRI